MLKVGLGAVLAVTLGCSEQHWGPEQTEAGTVVALSYMPAGHGSATGYNFGRGGGMVYSSVTIPERYGVVFKCQHGSFAVEGDKAHRVFGRVSQGHAVTIHYRVQWETTKDGEVPVDMEFLGAEDVK